MAKLNNDLVPTEEQSATLINNIDGAISSIDKLSREIKTAENKVHTAIQEAKKAKDNGVSCFRKRSAIEALQAVAVAQAVALESSITASKALFENQQQIADAVKHLYIICAGNLAATRVAIKEVRMRLEGATEASLSQMARQELYAAMLQLKAQEDFMVRIDNLENIIREHRDKLGELSERLKAQEESMVRIDNLENTLHEHRDYLDELSDKINDIHIVLSQLDSLVDVPPKMADILTKVRKRSLFDSAFFKIVVALMAVVAILLHFIEF